LAATERADARAADQDPSIRAAGDDRLAEPLREIRVVVVGIGAVATQVDELVPEVGRRQAAEQLVLESGPGMIGRKSDAHAGKDTADAGSDASLTTLR